MQMSDIVVKGNYGPNSTILCCLENRNTNQGYTCLKFGKSLELTSSDQISQEDKKIIKTYVKKYIL